MDEATGMAKLQALALDVFDPEMQAAIEAAGGLHGISEGSLTSLLLVQLLRDSMREVIDVAGGDHGAS
jgi:hypothetical protein